MGVTMYEWDESKRAANIAKHGTDFKLIYQFEWEGALILEDVREDYNESRFYALGMVGDRLYAVIFTLRNNLYRIISMRKANSRERKHYDGQA